MANTLKFGNGEWYGKKDTILAYNDENSNYKPLPFDFSRASSATVVNKAGLIETVGSGEPRIDYKDDVNGALLLEPQRTNQVPYSQTYTSGWTFDDSTITENSTISPDGNINAALLKGSTVSSRHNISITSIPVGSVTGSFSLFVKAKELKYLQIASANTVNQYVNFDVESGIIGTVGSSFSNAKIENYGNGWYRISVVSPNQYNGYYISLVSGLTATWLESWIMPNNTDGLHIFGAQIEQGSYATSYIPTQGSTVTRLADACTNGGNEQVINSTEGVLYFEGSALSDDNSDRKITLSDGSLNNAINFGFSRFSGNINAEVKSGGVLQTSGFGATGITQDNNNKFALSWGGGVSKFYVNGTLASSHTSVTSPIGMNVLNFSLSSGFEKMYLNCKDLRVYNTTLTDNELQQLTTI